jgi:hypothetical protein
MPDTAPSPRKDIAIILGHCHTSYLALLTVAGLLLALGLSAPVNDYQRAINELQDTQAWAIPDKYTKWLPFEGTEDLWREYYNYVAQSVRPERDARLLALLAKYGITDSASPGGPSGIYMIEDSENRTPLTVFYSISQAVRTGTVGDVLNALECPRAFYWFEPEYTDVERVLRTNETSHLLQERSVNYLHFDIVANVQNGRTGSRFREGLAVGYVWLQAIQHGDKADDDSAIFYSPPNDNAIHGSLRSIKVSSNLREQIAFAQRRLQSPSHSGPLAGPYSPTGEALPATRLFFPDIQSLSIRDAIAWLRAKPAPTEKGLSVFGMSFSYSQAIIVGPGLLIGLLWYFIANLIAARDCSDTIALTGAQFTWIGTQPSRVARLFIHLTTSLVPIAAVAEIVLPPSSILGWIGLFLTVCGVSFVQVLLWRLHRAITIAVRDCALPMTAEDQTQVGIGE